MHLTSRKLGLFAVTTLFCACLAVQAQSISLPHCFSDNMVLQQGTSVPIWGWGLDGDIVTVSFQGQTATAKVANGEWKATLSGLKPGGPFTMTITTAKDGKKAAVHLKNILVGEVWLASGQSNMEFPLKRSYHASNDIAISANPMIHLLKVPRARLASETNDIGASWSECNPDTVANFSAVEYYFGRDLQANLKVPVGLIESDWGGTPIEEWMEGEYLHASPKYRQAVYGEWIIAQDEYERALAKYEKAKAEAKAAGGEYTNAAPKRPWKPGELYNGMIAPLAGYAIKGALWYQGESNAGDEQSAWLYHSLLPDLIRDWRGVWGRDPFTFLVVQLAPFRAIQPQPSESAWASVREAQLQATKILPNVGLAVITDVGDERDIHPTKKEPVGARLALAARGIAYHQPIEYSGPVLRDAKLDDDQIVLTFDHVAGGLVSDGSELRGFSICGTDGKFVWASAEIKGLNQILVHSTAVANPVAVRYGWANYPVVNLWNKAGLPASPFRTDDFELRPDK